MKKGSPLIILLIAVAVLAGVSLLPLSRWTGGKVKDFSLVSDILKETGIIEGTPSWDEPEDIDPELLKAQQEEAKADSLAALAAIAPKPGDPIDTIISPVKPCRVGELVQIEDYTTLSNGLSRLRSTLASGSLARIAVVGDSYIEGDIFTQDLRTLLQAEYGGEGVGYVNMHTDFPGFRRSIKQGGSGWTSFTANKKAQNRYLDLAEQYFTPKGTALSTYAGTKATPPFTERWSRSRFLFLAPQGAQIDVKTDEAEWETRNIAPSDSVQSIDVARSVSKFAIRTTEPSLIGLGVWLDGNGGVSVDCMSSRGFSGITLSRISPELCSQMSAVIDYDLIVLEFGINAMSAKQKNYTVYCKRMVDVINHVRLCYPHADILLMGVGDRGEKHGAQVRSMSTAPYMIEAQRDAARRAHCLFWDTREAMGGEGAVVAWSSEGLINKDYIHLTHKGGARLAAELFKAIQQQLTSQQ